MNIKLLLYVSCLLLATGSVYGMEEAPFFRDGIKGLDLDFWKQRKEVAINTMEEAKASQCSKDYSEQGRKLAIFRPDGAVELYTEDSRKIGIFCFQMFLKWLDKPYNKRITLENP